MLPRREKGVVTKQRTPRSRIMAMLSYLGILCLVPLIFNQSDEYVDFHARQGIVLWTWGVLSILALHVPVVGPFFFSFSAMVIGLLSLVGLVSVLLSRAWRIPGIGVIATKL
uniref:Magnetosome protein MmsF. MamF-like protein n=1 Tax=Magnetococcus massalia (strain MO-1) TaxID=451514 RepID=A0A1S7LFH9_MAGMO|nr:Magnetosome protein MmsF. MamF-like protein [Candidatus Magnetococcus massalia]